MHPRLKAKFPKCLNGNTFGQNSIYGLIHLAKSTLELTSSRAPSIRAREVHFAFSSTPKANQFQNRHYGNPNLEEKTLFQMSRFAYRKVATKLMLCWFKKLQMVH